jgi:hypothetical protein
MIEIQWGEWKPCKGCNAKFSEDCKIKIEDGDCKKESVK